MMNTNLNELDTLLVDLDSTLDKLINLGLSFENDSQYDKALFVYKKGLERAEKATSHISGTMIGLLD